jgi:flagellar hook-associated protein 2
MTSSVDGLISGMSTSQVISQLMQVESLGQTKLKTKVSDQEKAITAWQSVNSKLANLKTASDALQQSATWQPASATSSSTSVKVTAATGAVNGQFTFNVNALASAQTSTATVASTGSIQTVPPTGLSITSGGTTHNITVTTDTAQGVVDAINAKGIEVKAALINTQQGTVLQLTSTKTGAANTFSVSGLDATFTNISTAADAEIGVGTVGAGGYTVRSATNTFSNVLTNVTLNVSKVENGVTVTVNRDADAIAAKVQAMVDAANAALTDASTQGKLGSATVKGGPLGGNFLLTSTSGKILSAVSGGLTGYGSYKSLGVQLDKTGKLTFDKAAFATAYQADPIKTQNAVSTGLATSFEDLATEATKNIESTIQNGNNTIRILNDQIKNWDVRLASRQAALQKQFANLETSLGKLKSQSSWLAGQLASL